METTDHSRRCPGPTVVGMLVLVLVLVAGGCQTPIHLGRLATIKNPFTGSMKKIRFRTHFDKFYGDDPEDEEEPVAATTEERSRRADQLYRDGKFAEAEAAAGQVAPPRSLFANLGTRDPRKKEKEQDQTLGSVFNPSHRDPDAAVKEDALFLLAESQYSQRKYPKAADNYSRLLKDYPSTRHMTPSTRRLFTIARYWLEGQGFKAAASIRPASIDIAAGDPPRPTIISEAAKWPLSANLSDSTRPLFDTRGRAMRALKEIWMNDPTGPLADDALMFTAAIEQERGEFREADRIYQNLRKLYPNSPYTETAFLLGSHVKLMSYQGAAYDEGPLLDARKLKRSTLALFPEIKEREQLEKELGQIEHAVAERAWDRVRFYQKKDRPRAMAVYLAEIVREHPGSDDALRARQMLVRLGPEYSKGTWMRVLVAESTPQLKTADSGTESKPPSDPAE